MAENLKSCPAKHIKLWKQIICHKKSDSYASTKMANCSVYSSVSKNVYNALQEFEVILKLKLRFA